MEARRRQRAIVNIRREFSKAGYPLDHFADSQIEAALTLWNDDISAVTVSAKIIYRAIKRLQRVARSQQNLRFLRELRFPRTSKDPLIGALGDRLT